VQTDGINFNAAWTFSDCVDVNRIRTNHVAAMLETYGIEAARAALMQEVSGVFGVYGIGVDPRHLSLITDFMTFQVRVHALREAWCVCVCVEGELPRRIPAVAHSQGTQLTFSGDVMTVRSSTGRVPRVQSHWY